MTSLESNAEPSDVLSQDALFAAILNSQPAIDDVISSCCEVEVVSAQKGTADDVQVTTTEGTETENDEKRDFLRRGWKMIVHVDHGGLRLLQMQVVESHVC